MRGLPDAANFKRADYPVLLSTVRARLPAPTADGGVTATEAVVRVRLWLISAPGRTQADAARIIGVNIKTVNDWLNFRKVPRNERSLRGIGRLQIGG